MTLRRKANTEDRRKYQVYTDLQVIGAYEDDLSPQHFQVLCASAAGKSYEQIAAELAMPIGTVKSRLNRARNALEVLAEDDRKAEVAAKHEEPQS